MLYCMLCSTYLSEFITSSIRPFQYHKILHVYCSRLGTARSMRSNWRHQNESQCDVKPLHLDSFQTGSGQAGVVAEVPRFPTRNFHRNVWAECGNTCALKTSRKLYGDLWPFCENPVCPDPVWKPVIIYMRE